jgi:hypothetical protein
MSKQAVSNVAANLCDMGPSFFTLHVETEAEGVGSAAKLGMAGFLRAIVAL